MTLCRQDPIAGSAFFDVRFTPLQPLLIGESEYYASLAKKVFPSSPVFPTGSDGVSPTNASPQAMYFVERWVASSAMEQAQCRAVLEIALGALRICGACVFVGKNFLGDNAF